MSLSQPLSRRLVPEPPSYEIRPAAAAYAAETGLDPSRTEALSRHLDDLDAAGIQPVAMFLGRSEWLARNSNQLRAVIGEPASITGSVTDAEEGQVFPGTADNYCRFPNPLQSDALESFGMFAVARCLSGVATGQTILSSYGGAARGPAMFMNASPLAGVVADDLQCELHSAAAAGPGRVRHFVPANRGEMLPVALGFTGGQAASCTMGAWVRQHAATSTLETLWNNNSEVSLGGRVDQTNSITGAIAYALVTSDDVCTSAKHAALLQSGLKHGLFDVAADAVVLCMGDSLMESSAGSVPMASRIFQQLTMAETGGDWEGAAHPYSVAVGGTGVDHFEVTQNPDVEPWMAVTELARWVLFFGSHNDTASASSDAAERNALVDRYLAILAGYAAAGANVIVVSPLISTSRSSGEQANHALFRARLSMRAAQEGIHYLDLWADPDFSVDDRNGDYFVDALHLSAAGQARVVEMLVDAFPNPTP